VPSTVIPRFLAKIFLAAGFIAGIYGVTEPNDTALRSALGLIIAGVLAGAYGLVRRLLRTQS
jgi:hypothetical protein